MELLPTVFALVPEFVRREKLHVARGYASEEATPKHEEMETHRDEYPEVREWIFDNYQDLIDAIHNSEANNKLEMQKNILISVKATLRVFKVIEGYTVRSIGNGYPIR